MYDRTVEVMNLALSSESGYTTKEKSQLNYWRYSTDDHSTQSVFYLWELFVKAQMIRHVGKEKIVGMHSYFTYLTKEQSGDKWNNGEEGRG